MKRINLVARKFILFLLSTIMVLMLININIIIVLADEFEHDRFFNEASRLVADNWDDGFIGSIVFTIGSPYMLVDGVPVEIDPGTGTTPAVVDGRTLLPIRALVEEIGGSVSFEPTHQRVIIYDDQMLELQIGSTIMSVDGELEYIDVAPIIINGRTMLPLRAIADNLGFDEPKWDSVTQQVTLTRSFQTRRLIVRTSFSMDFNQFNATDIIQGPDNITVLQFSTIHETYEAYGQLSVLDAVIWVEPDTYIPPFEEVMVSADFPSLGSFHRSWGVERIGADRYAEFLRNNGRDQRVVVAVLDTGVNSGHSFLQGRMVDGWCFITYTSNPYDIQGHGTHVAGTIVDSTPGLNIQIAPVKVLNNRGSGTDLNIGNGIRWAATRSDVINMSLGGFGRSRFMYDSIQYAN